jgi:hypothetical protein
MPDPQPPQVVGRKLDLIAHREMRPVAIDVTHAQHLR